MSREKSQRRHNVRRQLKKQVIFLSDNALYIWHQCRSRAIENIQKGQRFSLISGSDYQATIAAQAVRSLHRRSVPSEQIFGFHVVCAECEGFVVRNGAVKSCKHQTDSASSLSVHSRDAVRRSGGQVKSDVHISVQPPTPSSTPEPDISGNCAGSAEVRSENMETNEENRTERPEARETIPAVLCPGFYSEDTGAGQESPSVKQKKREAVPPILHPGFDSENIVPGHESQSLTPKKRGSVPAILRPGYVAKQQSNKIIERTGEALGSNTSIALKSQGLNTAAATDGIDLSLRAGAVVRENRHHHQKAIESNPSSDESDSTDQSCCDSDALMQDWREWSERWETSLLTGVKRLADNTVGIYKPHCESEPVIQQWRAWSERWEKSVRMP